VDRPPSPDIHPEAAGSLRVERPCLVYHLAADEVALGRGVLESHLTTMAAGLCPPLTIAVDVLAWLRAEHPEMIAVEALR
jgi:hypothetical protein